MGFCGGGPGPGEVDGVVLVLRRKRPGGRGGGVLGVRLRLDRQKQGMGCAWGGQEDREGWVCLSLTRRCSWQSTVSLGILLSRRW